MAYCAKKPWFYILPICVVIVFSFYEWTISWPKYYTDIRNRQLYVTVAPIQDIHSTTKSLGIWESASFMAYRASLPKYDQILARPPIQESYLYAGLGLWESRGISLPHAVAAMLGDTGVFYETPLFTLYKTQILGVNVADFVYDTNFIDYRDFSGYNNFMVDVVPFTSAVQILVNIGYKRVYINAAKQNETLASELAKILVDLYFYRRMECNNKYKCNDILPNFKKFYLSEVSSTKYGDRNLGTPNDILWTTPYLSYALPLGPNIIVLDPEANSRSLCLGDWKNFNNLVGIGKGIGRDQMGGEVVHPGYIYGSFIRGFELRLDPRTNPQSTIRLAFYKRNSIIGEEKSYVIVVAPTDNSTYCIINNENLPLTSTIKSPPLTSCDFSSTKGLNQKVSTYTVTNFHNFRGPCDSMCDSIFTKRQLMEGNNTSLPVAGKD